jgi:hypothetical protein
LRCNDHRGEPRCQGADALQRRLFRVSMARQIEGEHIPAAEGEPAAVQGPYGMVESGTVYQQCQRSTWLMGSTPRRAINSMSADRELRRHFA